MSEPFKLGFLGELILEFGWNTLHRRRLLFLRPWSFEGGLSRKNYWVAIWLSGGDDKNEQRIQSRRLRAGFGT